LHPGLATCFDTFSVDIVFPPPVDSLPILLHTQFLFKDQKSISKNYAFYVKMVHHCRGALSTQSERSLYSATFGFFLSGF